MDDFYRKYKKYKSLYKNYEYNLIGGTIGKRKREISSSIPVGKRTKRTEDDTPAGKIAQQWQKNYGDIRPIFCEGRKDYILYLKKNTESEYIKKNYIYIRNKNNLIDVRYIGKVPKNLKFGLALLLALSFPI